MSKLRLVSYMEQFRDIQRSLKRVCRSYELREGFLKRVLMINTCMDMSRKHKADIVQETN